MPELPLSYDLKIVANRTFTKTFRWLPGGEEQDFTGWTARLQIRAVPVDFADDPLIELTTDAEGGIELTNDGYINLTATPDQTIVLEDVVRPRYDLALRSPDDTITTFITGIVNVVPYVSDVPDD